MIVNIDQARTGVKKYIENEIAYKASGLTKFMVYFALPSIDSTVYSYINKMKTNDIFADLFDHDGNLQLDKIYDRAIFAADKSGKIYLDKFGLSLDRSDVEKIYSYIRES